ncbi:MAG: HAD hydrolase family protein [Gemmatimonadetes bacterium]|nr:HAD hydrolase family protein [Gemmatimonadota bacterium]MCC6771728.1 HAD hydrolase family protein [Gemmatimonadaceae bacterium]
MPPRLLFSDVDGTLLGADGRYAMSAAELAPAVRELDLVLASSRTVLELARNQRDLGIDGPVVAENGAVMGWPSTDSLSSVGLREDLDGRAWRVVLIGMPASELRAEVREAAKRLGTTYVDQEDVDPALGRRCSVLLRPIPGRDFDALDALAAVLRLRGLSVASGGSWLAVTGGADKGDGVRAVRDWWRRAGREHALVAAAGDGDNDIPLLLACDRRFVIARDDGTWHPALQALPGVECIETPGIAGWCDVIRRLTRPQEM